MSKIERLFKRGQEFEARIPGKDIRTWLNRDGVATVTGINGTNGLKHIKFWARETYVAFYHVNGVPVIVNAGPGPSWGVPRA